MHIRFWGTRGSIAKPGPTTFRYGGNTSCVEVRSNSGTLVVLDCGTGAHPLGQALLEQPGGGSRGHLLISHTHWDHIQGLPFFAPLFVAGSEWDIYGPKGLSQGLRQTLAGQMEHTYFPISLDDLGARIRYHDLVEGVFAIDDIEISTHYLNHPALTLGYRLRADGATLIYACDHEPNVAAAASGDVEITGNDCAHVAFLDAADVVVHDAQYVATEFPEKAGWGHSSAEYVVRVCHDAGVGTVVLTHHDPLRDDDAVDRLLEAVRMRAATTAPGLRVLAAAEGSTLRIEPVVSGDAPPLPEQFPATTPLDATTLARPILIHVTDAKVRDLLQEAALLEGLPTPVVLPASATPAEVSADAYALVLVQHDPPAIDALALVHRLRANTAAAIQVPVAIVTFDQALAQRESAAASDWLLAPFGLSYARTKIRAWVLRVACRWIRAQTPHDEARRLAALNALWILDTEPETCFDRITRIAAATFHVPIALVSLVDRDRQWFKSCIGLDARETSREAAFCAHAVEQRSDLIIPDALADERFADNPCVVGPPRIRFYAGAPLIMGDGSCVGTLCLLDRRPRTLSAADIAVLHDLRDLVLAELEARSAAADATS
ncbi:MAG: GAF domain-containing protein [Casimicrobiaceae bacterium]